MQKDSERLRELSINHPSAWDMDRFRANWLLFVETLLKEEANSLIPSRRIRWQIEQTPAFQEVVADWDNMDGSHRLDAWKRLLLAAEEAYGRFCPPASSAASAAGWGARPFTWKILCSFSPAKSRGISS